MSRSLLSIRSLPFVEEKIAKLSVVYNKLKGSCSCVSYVLSGFEKMFNRMNEKIVPIAAALEPAESREEPETNRARDLSKDPSSQQLWRQALSLIWMLVKTPIQITTNIAAVVLGLSLFVLEAMSLTLSLLIAVSIAVCAFPGTVACVFMPQWLFARNRFDEHPSGNRRNQ